MRLVVACVCLACGIAHGAPKGPVRDKLVAAQKLAAEDDNEKALELVDQGLAIAPKDLELLQLRGALLLKTRDYTGAVAAYQSFLDAGAAGAGKREALKIVNSLRAVKSTFVDLTANTDASIYLDTKTAGVFCTAPCKKALLPGDYKLIAERAGFERLVQKISIPVDKTTPIKLELFEKLSPLTAQVTPEGALITIDGKPFDSAPIDPGEHEVVVRLTGFATHRQKVTAREGTPIAIAVTLVPLVAVSLSPAEASVTVDGEPAVFDAGRIAIPAGAHTVVARAPKHHEQRIEVPADRSPTYKVEIALREVGTLVDVTGAPKGAKVMVDGKHVATAPLTEPLEVSPGFHRVEVTVRGFRPYTTGATFVSEQRGRLSIGTLRRDDRRRTLIAGATTGAVLLGGVAMSVLAIGKESDYDARARQPGVTPDDPELASLRSSGKRFSLLADFGFGLAIAGIGITTYLFTHEGTGESEGSLRIGIGPGGATASLRF